jgi:hypothetical protein
MSKIIDLEKYVVGLLFGRLIARLRTWRIKRYKSKKVKVEAKNSPEKIYHMHFRIAIRDKDGAQACDNVFDIEIPANGYYFAKKKLERFVVGNIDVEVVDFEAVSQENDEQWKKENTPSE